MMSNFSRLHPLSILSSFFSDLKTLFFSFILLYIWISKYSIRLFFLVLIAIIALMLIGRIIGWFRFHYRVLEDELQIEEGVFIRKKTYISKYRIQSINVTEGILHRIFSLAELKVETASNQTSTLPAIRKAKAAELQEQLQTDKGSLTEAQDDVEENGLENQVVNEQTVTTKRLFFAGMTSSGVTVLLGAVLFLFSQIEEIIPDNVYNDATTLVLKLSVTIIVLVAFLALLLSWFVSIAMTMITNGKFTIRKEQEELIITRGLIEKKRLTIPLHRIQAIGFKQNLFREPFGFGTVYAEVAGGEIDPQQKETAKILFPIMKKSEINAFLEQFVDRYGKWEDTFIQPPKRALLGYLMRVSWVFFIGLIVSIIFIPTYSWITGILVLLSLLLGYARYKAAGIYMDEGRLAIQFRRYGKTRLMTMHKRVQMLERKQHPFQRRSNLASIRLAILNSIGGVKYHLKSFEEHDVHQVTSWYRALIKERN